MDKKQSRKIGKFEVVSINLGGSNNEENVCHARSLPGKKQKKDK
jgi:hypothetical protein